MKTDPPEKITLLEILQSLDNTEKAALSALIAISSYTADNKHRCQLWYRPSKDEYARMSVNSKIAEPRSFLAHRVAYFSNRNHPLEDQKKHVSHLCHQKHCVNILHLSLEDPSNNQKRNTSTIIYN